MLPSVFVESAGLPIRWKESDLQDYLAQKLKSRGFTVQTEVKANGGRADILTDWQGGSIIEVKKYLDRNTIYQAYGQLNLYGLNNKHKLVVMGLLVVDSGEQKSALTTASMIEQDTRVSVVFVNHDQNWVPGNQVASSCSPWFSLPKIPKFDDWQWWLNLVKSNPLLLFVAIALLITVTPIVEEKYEINLSGTSRPHKLSPINHRDPIK